MSQGLQPEQTLQMPDMLKAELGLTGRVQELGNRVVEWAQASWESTRRYVPHFALAGLTVVGTTEAVPAEAATSYHHHSTMSTQKVLNRIHARLPVGDYQAKGEKIRPYEAYLEPNSGGFKTHCEYRYSETWKSYSINPEGTSGQSCRVAPYPPETKSNPGEFKPAMNDIGRHIRESVGITVREHTNRIYGTRKEVTAIYTCPPAPTKAPKKIVLDKAKTGSHATITSC
jgi:hypothetical protein